MKKKTLKEKLKYVEDELQKDEGAWLKSLGSLGDLARLVLNLQERIEKLEEGYREDKRQRV